MAGSVPDAASGRDLPVFATPDAELAPARRFLSGWTLARLLARLEADDDRSPPTSGGDGVTPEGPGRGAFGWTRLGPPREPRSFAETAAGAAGASASPASSARPPRRRPPGVLTLPTSATVGQALRDLAAADVLAAPAVDTASGDYAGWVSCGDLLRQLLRALYPRVLDPELLAEDDVAAFLARDADDGDRGGRGKNAEYPERDAAAIDARPSSPSSRPSERRNVAGKTDEKKKPREKPSVLDELVRDAASELESAWRRVVRVGDDGDACFDAFADTTLLDLLSRGLCNRTLCDKRRGDFEPCHRIVVYGEKRTEADRKARGVEETTSEKPATTSWRTVVSQLDALELMTRDADALGAFPRVQTMDSLGFARAPGPPGVVSVSENLPAFACFALMNNCDVSGVPVLDASRRRLVDTVSVSDVRLFDSAESLADLAAPIGAFLEKRKRRRMSGGRGGFPSVSPRAPVVVRPDASLLEAMRAMVENGTHRVYVCDEPGAAPRGVCTCTDVTRVFAVDPDSAEGRMRLTW